MPNGILNARKMNPLVCRKGDTGILSASGIGHADLLEEESLVFRKFVKRHVEYLNHGFAQTIP